MLYKCEESVVEPRKYIEKNWKKKITIKIENFQLKNIFQFNCFYKQKNCEEFWKRKRKEEDWKRREIIQVVKRIKLLKNWKIKL